MGRAEACAAEEDAAEEEHAFVVDEFSA